MTLPKLKYEVRMLTSGISILVETYDEPAPAIARCEAEADKTGVSHSVREIETRTIHRSQRASSEKRQFAEAVGAMIGERLST